MTYNTVLVEKERYVASIIMTRPQNKNSWNEDMLEDLVKAIHEVSEDKEIRLVVFSGKGEDFSVGGDMRSESAFVTHERYKNIETFRQAARYHWQRIVRCVWDLEKPTLAMVRGWVAGEGMGLALACDLRIGSKTSKFLIAPTRYGTLCFLGEPWLLLQHIGLGRTMQLYLCSEAISSEEAYRIGILNWLVPDEMLEDETRKLSDRLAEYPPIALNLGKLLIRKMIHWDFDTALEMTAVSTPIVEFSEDHHEAIAAFMEKRDPKPFKGK